MNHPPSRDSLLPPRTAIILLIGVVLGLVVGVLFFIAGTHLALAVVSGMTAAGAAINYAHSLIGR